MSNKMTGVDEVIEELNKKIGSISTDKVLYEVMQESSEPILQSLENDLPEAGTKSNKYWSNKGIYKRGFVLSKPKKIDGKLYASIGQRKGNKRGPLTHLLEFGSIKNPKPRQAGALQRAITRNRQRYINNVKENLRGRLK